MDKDELDVLRRRVANEPGDERGALARILMDEIDRLNGAKAERARADLIASLIETWHLTREQSERYVDIKPLPLFGTKMGTCRACGGRGIQDAGRVHGR